MSDAKHSSPNLANTPFAEQSSLILRKQHLANIDKAEAAAQQIAQALQEVPVLWLQGMNFTDTSMHQWHGVIEALGEPINDGEDSNTGEKNDTLWSDVRYDAALQHTFRHSSTAQPLHTDCAYNPSPVDVVFFLCQDGASSGGETIFVSAQTIDETARAYDRDLHAQLWDLPVPYGKAGQQGRSMPVLRKEGNNLLLNWNYYRVLGSESPAIENFRQRFHTFLQQEIVDKGLVEPVRMKPGDGLFFRDEYVLHGRHSFAPSPRCIWKCGFNWRSPN